MFQFSGFPSYDSVSYTHLDVYKRQLHGGTPNNCIYECIVFDINLLLKQNHACTKLLQDIIHNNKIINPKMPSNILVLNLNCEFLFDSLSSQYEGYEFITQGSLYNFLGIILQNKLYTVNNNMSLRTNDKIILFKKVLLFIEENYTCLLYTSS